MNLLLSTTRPYNRPGTNGATIPVIKARGMAHRNMDYPEALNLGAKLRLGLVSTSHYSVKQVLDFLPIPVSVRDLEEATAWLKRELQLTARNGNGNGRGHGHGHGNDNGNGETPEPGVVTEVIAEDAPVTTTSTEAEVLAPVSDTPEVRVSIRRLAASLGCSITQLDEETVSVFDCGPYALIDNASGDRVWHCGLPLQGILDALHRLARERHLPAEQKDEAWIGFGFAWRK